MQSKILLRGFWGVVPASLPTFWMHRGWAKSVPPWRRNPQGDPSKRASLTVISWAILEAANVGPNAP